MSEVELFQRVRTGVVASALVVASAVLAMTDAVAADSTTGTTASTVRLSQDLATRATGKPVLKPSSKQVEEGARFTLAATIRSPKSAQRATLQKSRTNVITGTQEWEPVKTIKARSDREITYKRVATDENTERYRLSVTYKNAKRPVVSEAVSVTVWRWIPLSEYDPYYEAEPYAAIFGTTTINGIAYKGWGAASYSHTGTWENRFTPGRHCKSFKSVLGLADISADGTSGTIGFTADDTNIYSSPVLTPGMSVPVTVAIAKPYRFGIQLIDTTPGGTSTRDDVESWPVLGEPAFLCTGV